MTQQASKDSIFRSPWIWVPTIYFAEGYPYAFANDLAPALFTEFGASLAAVGLTSLLHLPWNLKWVWAPFVDSFETLRRWILAVEALLFLSCAALALSAISTEWLGTMAGILMVVAVLSATHDIAIDGFYMEALDKKGQARFVGLRAMPWKVAGLLVGGPLVVLAGRTGWRLGLGVASAVMGVLFLIHCYVLPWPTPRKQPLSHLLRGRRKRRAQFVVLGAALVFLFESEFRPLRSSGTGISSTVGAIPVLGNISTSGWIGLTLLVVLLLLLVFRKPILARLAKSDGAYGATFGSFIAQPKVGRILAFAILFRTGESFLIKMKWPFLRDGVGMTVEQIGWVNGTVGVIASFTATLVGGWLIARHGLRRWIWPFVVAQNLLNLLYMGLAVQATGEAVAGVGLVQAVTAYPTVTAVICAEQFGQGLGTAVFMVYLMRCCAPGHKATHFAILSSVMSLSFTFAGVASGFLAAAIGFTNYFALSFVATVPAMVLIFFIPHLDGREPV